MPKNSEMVKSVDDTQWPKYEVFIQSREGHPHKNVGSVHAPDSEMALMNARDVFVRRPNCNSLWVVPADAILTRSEEELRLTSLADQALETSEGTAQRYVVFQKQSQRNSMTYVTFSGTVEAGSLEAALMKARESSTDLTVYVWWICAESAITRSDINDISSMFNPAKDKKYRLPQSYRVLTEMLEAKNDNLLLSDIENS